MRAVSSLAALLALAACQVNVEGAPCAQPGKTADCPGGQACGNDLRCSARAAACAAASSLCTPGVAPNRCRADRIETCTAGGDPVCGAWSVVAAKDDCAATALVCDASSGPPACVCATPASVLAVDLAAPQTALSPTGAEQPPQCRFPGLRDALAAAGARGGAMTVKVLGEAGSPVVFAGESLPIVVPAEVTLVGADAPAGDTVIQGDAGTAATVVDVQGTLERVHVENVSMTGIAVDLSCGATGTPTLRDVVVSISATGAPTPFAKGVTVSGACGALLERVDVSGATGAALDVGVPASAPVTVRGSSFHGSGAGIRAVGGKLVLAQDPASSRATQVADNKGPGIVLTGATQTDAALTDLVVARNEGTGIHVDSIPSASTLTVTGCDVHSNGTVSPTSYGPLLGKGLAGGILLSQSDLATFLMESNRIYGNHGATNGADELAFDSSGTWKLSATGCASANSIGCVASGAFAVRATGGTVDASTMYWHPYPPHVSGNVNGTADYCDVWSVTCPP